VEALTPILVDQRAHLRYNDCVKKWLYGITLVVALLSVTWAILVTALLIWWLESV